MFSRATRDAISTKFWDGAVGVGAFVISALTGGDRTLRKNIAEMDAQRERAGRDAAGLEVWKDTWARKPASPPVELVSATSGAETNFHHAPTGLPARGAVAPDPSQIYAIDDVT